MRAKKTKTYSRLELFLRSLVYSIYMIITLVVYSAVVILSIVLPMRYRHVLVRAWLKSNLWVLEKVCLIKYKVKGLENIPKDRKGIVLSKHQSTWETFYLPLLFHEPAIIVKRELLWVPFFGWGMAVTGPIAINRNDKASAMQQIIRKGKQCLQDGRWILMFPEGTRVPYGTVGHYKMGGARLAAATGYPVLPVAHNAGRFWARRKFIKEPGTITIVIGPLIESTGRKPEEILKLAKGWIESTMQTLHQ